MIISNYLHRLFKKTFLILVFCSISMNSQQLQRIGFVDIEYVLENIPSYANAQQKLNTETTIWKGNLDKMYLKLDTMNKEFLNEKPLLTEDLIEERETEIKIYQNEITKVENTYFGVEGKLFELRKELVIPYQDVVYNAVQTIAKFRKYDMIFEKSSSIVMLYTNNNYDISELVLKYIQKSEKEIEQEEEAAKRAQAKLAREKRVQDQRNKRKEYLKKREEERNKRSQKSEPKIEQQTEVSPEASKEEKQQETSSQQLLDTIEQEETYQKSEKELKLEAIAAKKAKAKADRAKRIQDQKDRREAYLKKREEQKKKLEEERKQREEELKNDK